MIYLFSMYKTDMSGNKEVFAFRNFPEWQDIQTCIPEGPLFHDMKNILSQVKLGIEVGVNKVYAWDFQDFKCQIFAIDLVENKKTLGDLLPKVAA